MFVGEAGSERRKLWRRKPIEEPFGERFGHEEIGFVIDPGEGKT